MKAHSNRVAFGVAAWWGRIRQETAVIFILIFLIFLLSTSQYTSHCTLIAFILVGIVIFLVYRWIFVFIFCDRCKSSAYFFIIDFKLKYLVKDVFKWLEQDLGLRLVENVEVLRYLEWFLFIHVGGRIVMKSVEFFAVKLMFKYIQWDTGLCRALIRYHLIFWILGQHFITIWIDVISRVIWILPHCYQFQQRWQNSTGLPWNLLKIWKGSIKKEEVNSSNAAQMRSSKATYRYSMHSNLDRAHIIDSLYGLLPGPLIHKLNISSIWFGRWVACTLSISTIVPENYVDSKIKVILCPIWWVLLNLCIAHIRIAKDHCAVCLNACIMKLFKSFWRRQPKNLYIVVQCVAFIYFQEFVLTIIFFFHLSHHLGQRSQSFAIHKPL